MKKQIILGITGGISAYKVPEIIRKLDQNNIQSICVLTASANKFITKTTLGTVSGINPIDDQFYEPGKSPHLDLSKTSQVLAIVPASANTIAKLAHGIADNLLTTLFLSFKGPKLIVPAMHTEMWENPITQKNIQILKNLGTYILGPIAGNLACGDTGIGRMISSDIIANSIQTLLNPPLNLKNKNILITAGGTTEYIDPVRFISNHSTGQLGFQLACVASLYGANVTLITTKPYLQNPSIKKIIQVESAQQMQKSINQEIKDAKYLYMTSAVSDFSFKRSETKLKRSQNFSLELKPTPDILQSLSQNKQSRIHIGFCLETSSNLKKSALQKLKSKNLDYIIANTPQNIGNHIRSATIYSQSQEPISLINLSLPNFSYKILSETI